MASIRVVASELPPSSHAQAVAAQAATGPEFDRHNRPRRRRDVILAALRERYPQLTNFATPPPVASSAEGCNLPSLYGRVHDPNMVQFLIDAWSKWAAMGPRWDEDNCLASPSTEPNAEDAPPPLVPCHSAFRRDNNDGDDLERPSSNVMGAVGYYCTDFITPIVATLADELRHDAAVICHAVDAAFAPNTDVVYAVTTHPGHHASRECFGGYCYLNNAALCARLMQRRLETGEDIINNGTILCNCWEDVDGKRPSAMRRRVAILDVDYHCGNGTSSIFYRDPDVLFVSIHCDPAVDYPWNTGYADQMGVGEGTGTTLHIPLAPGATWEGAYQPALERALQAIAEFGAEALVISLGLDTHEGDKVAVNRGGFQLKGKDYREMGLCMGRHVKETKNIPVAFVQEGGYRMDVVGAAAADVVGGFADGAKGSHR